MEYIEINKTSIIFSEKDLIKNLQFIENSRILVICDTQTKKHCLPVFQSLLPNIKFISYVIPNGESSKSLKECDKLVHFCMENHATRNDVLLALGGGVVCDLVGFTASIYKRGMRCILFPTTLLAMVDAAIGGKNGIDFKGIKNLFGTFFDPELVFLHIPFLKTLDKRHFESGKAEIVKTLLLGNENDWKKYVKNKKIDISNQLIKRCTEIKASYVNKDYYDKKERHALNFGHTIGHALEAYSISRHPNPLIHGEAVAAGLICEMYLSHLNNGLEKKLLLNVTEILVNIFKQVNSDCLKYDNIKEFLKQDKKNINPGIPSFTLLESIGKPHINKVCSTSNIKEALAYYLEIYKKKTE